MSALPKLTTAGAVLGVALLSMSIGATGSIDDAATRSDAGKAGPPPDIAALLGRNTLEEWRPDPRKSDDILAERPQPPTSNVSCFGETPWSVQMNIHGSNSEGCGSMESLTAGAARIGLDAIWWTDHDWRMSYHRHVTRFDFDMLVEPVHQDEAWSPLCDMECGEKTLELFAESPAITHQLQVSQTQTYEGKGSVRLTATANNRDFEQVLYRLRSDRERERTSLASEPIYRIAVMPQLISRNARPVIAFRLSEHDEVMNGPVEIVPFGQYWLRYYLTNEKVAPKRRGLVYDVPLPYTPGAWNVYELDVRADVQAGFPWSDARDNSVRQFNIGMQARGGASGVAYFDDLVIERPLCGDDLLAVQREILNDLSARYPDVMQHQAVETSYIAHVMDYTPDAELIDCNMLYKAACAEWLADPAGYIPSMHDYRHCATHIVADEAHRRDGFVGLPHPFGTGLDPSPQTPEIDLLCKQLVECDCHGLDMIEVGYRMRERPLADLLMLWDGLTERGNCLVGNGVSNFKGGPVKRWYNDMNNMVTWIYADCPERDALYDGLRRGRAFFGDLAMFDGRVDLTTPAGHRMGQIILTDKPSIDVTFTIDGLKFGDRVLLVNQDGPFDERKADTLAGIVEVTHPVALSPGRFNFVRLEAYDRSSRIEMAFSNPIVITDRVPHAGALRDRIAVDARFFRTSHTDRVLVTDIDWNAPGADPDAKLTPVDLTISAENGQLLLAGVGVRPPKVELINLKGRIAVDGRVVTITDLSGDGVVRITPPIIEPDVNGDGVVNLRDLTLYIRSDDPSIDVVRDILRQMTR